MADDTGPPPREPIPPVKRRMLQQCFEHGSKSSAQGNFDYADQMFTQCVVGDPSNPIYVGSFIGNLHKKYNNNKTGAKLASVRGTAIKTSVKNSARKKDWKSVITSGLEMLKLNPWDASMLADIAQACEQLGYDECQIIYLSSAVDGDMRDPETNRVLARALGRQGGIRQGHRLLDPRVASKAQRRRGPEGDSRHDHRKDDREGAHDTAVSSTEVMADKQAQAERQGTAGPRAALNSSSNGDSPKIRRICRCTSNWPTCTSKRRGSPRPRRCWSVRRAASGGSTDMRERLEDIQLKGARKQVAIAEKRALAEKTDEAVKLVQDMKAELNAKELEVYRARCDRYPNNLGYRTELGLRLYKAKNFPEAIKAFQEARGDLKRKGMVLFYLGVCFESVKQHRLAVNNYELAIEETGTRDPEMQKQALYRAGVVAMDRLKDMEKAEHHLAVLAGLDFSYKDVSERLDKIQKIREDGDDSA